MKRGMLLALLLAMWLSSLLAGGQKDALYETLHKKAVRNLKYLPANARQDYESLLEKHPDRIMAFLLAYEESGRLVQANPQWLEHHWQSVADLCRERKISAPDEFFLSYVAKCTVSDEPVSDYRYVFEGDPAIAYNPAGESLKLLRQKNPDPVELYRIAMLKGTELLRYKPTSGRDQAPLDVATKSLYGRCEEYQILFIALCRTLGLPARPASTPWWAHQDDNHAWAEVFIDGKWVYDGGYWPEQNWFSGLSDKMVLIVADGTLPAADDEVLSRDEYGATINSIKNYAKEHVRRLTIRVVNKKGKPVQDCPLSFNVYNFYTLRPQAYTKTDKNGEKTVTVGPGAFFLGAFKDKYMALAFVPSGLGGELSYTLTLDQKEFPEIGVQMAYPNHPVTFREDPQSWKDASKKAGDIWQKKLDDAALLSSQEFFQKCRDMNKEEFSVYLKSLWGPEMNASAISSYYIRNMLEKRPELVNLQDSLYFQVLKRCHLNRNTFLGFDQRRVWYDQMALKSQPNTIEHYDKPPLSAPLDSTWLRILLDNDEKDLWQGGTDLFFVKLYRWYKYIYSKAQALPREELLNLLDPTVFYEPLPWQSHYLQGDRMNEMLYPQQMIMDKPDKPSPQQVIRFFHKFHKLSPNKALIGLLPLEVALGQKHLTGYQYKTLACYYLRANRIPANYTRIPYVVAVYTDSTWKYFDIKKNAWYETEKRDKERTRTVRFHFTDEQQQPVGLNPDQVQVSFFKEGQFFATNQKSVYKGNGVFEATIPVKGSYFAQVGYRSSDSLTVYDLIPLSVGQGEPVQVDRVLLNYHQKWKPAEAYLKPVLAQLDKRNSSCAILGHYTLENTIRMMNKLKVSGNRFTLIGYQAGVVEGTDYQVLPEYAALIRDIPSLQQRTITLVKDAKTANWQMYEGLWDKLPQ